MTRWPPPRGLHSPPWPWAEPIGAGCPSPIAATRYPSQASDQVGFVLGQDACACGGARGGICIYLWCVCCLQCVDVRARCMAALVQASSLFYCVCVCMRMQTPVPSAPPALVARPGSHLPPRHARLEGEPTVGPPSPRRPPRPRPPRPRFEGCGLERWVWQWEGTAGCCGRQAHRPPRPEQVREGIMAFPDSLMHATESSSTST
jgi:hypothetical protein